jgi:hypothetical protein
MVTSRAVEFSCAPPEWIKNEIHYIVNVDTPHPGGCQGEFYLGKISLEDSGVSHR